MPIVAEGSKSRGYDKIDFGTGTGNGDGVERRPTECINRMPHFFQMLEAGMPRWPNKFLCGLPVRETLALSRRPCRRQPLGRP